MEKLQMLKYAIWKNAQLNFTEGMSWAQELIEIEELQKYTVPTDIYSYVKSMDVEEDWEDVEDEEGDEEEGEGGGDNDNDGQ
jgi:hypothetical protein